TLYSTTNAISSLSLPDALPISRELADDLFKPSLSREGRRQPQHKRNQPPERLGHGHRVRPTLADLHEDLEGFFLRRFGHRDPGRSEEHTSELQSRVDLVCRLLL